MESKPAFSVQGRAVAVSSGPWEPPARAGVVDALPVLNEASEWRGEPDVAIPAAAERTRAFGRTVPILRWRRQQQPPQQPPPAMDEARPARTLSAAAAISPMWQRMKEWRSMYAVQPMRMVQERMSGSWRRPSIVGKRRLSTASSLGGIYRSGSISTSQNQQDAAIEASSDLDDFEMLGVLGRGTFGLVKLARHKDTGRSVAIKILTKDVIVEMKQEKNILREQTVHLLLQHPFVSKLYSTFQDSQALYFVLEYCPGGELYSLVYEEEEDMGEEGELCATESESEDDDERKGEPTTPEEREKSLVNDNTMAKKALRSEFGGLHERHVAFYLACLVLGLDYLHGMNILYRDLKLENLVLDEDGYPKLIDFGLSKPDAANNDQNTTMCGSMEYMAPEVLQRLPYGQKADMWSFGIIMYELLFGTTPFYHTNRREQGRRITMEPVPFPNNFEEEFPEATDLINKLLSKNPLERPTSFEQVRESAFFIKYFPTSSAWKQLENKKYPFGAPFVPHLDGAFDMSLFRAVDDEDDDAFEGY